VSMKKDHITVREAAFIGVGAMVGAGIFALLGEAGAVAGAAVWLSFLLAGVVAAFQGYSFAKFGARFPSAGGLLEYVARGFGDGHVTGAACWLTYASNIVVTALVAVSFGSYAAASFVGDDAGAVWVKVFAAAILLVMLAVNVVGSGAVAKVQSVIVWIVVGILLLFAVVTIVNMDPSLLAPSRYPGMREIVSSIALTFFAFLGFGIVTFTAKDLRDPARELPRAMYLALGIATITYVAVALGVFGTLTVQEVISSGGTAIAVAAKPTLGDLGFWLMSLTGLFATAGATNSGIYPAGDLSIDLAAHGRFPPMFGRHVRRAPVGMLVMVGATLVLTVAFNLSAIASIGSAVALLIFSSVTLGHIRVRNETGARLLPLLIGVLTTTVTLVVFVTTTLVHEEGAMAALGAIVALSIGLELWWSTARPRRSAARAERPAEQTPERSRAFELAGPEQRDTSEDGIRPATGDRP
jgi:amino acid transporter